MFRSCPFEILTEIIITCFFQFQFEDIFFEKSAKYITGTTGSVNAVDANSPKRARANPGKTGFSMIGSAIIPIMPVEVKKQNSETRPRVLL